MPLALDPEQTILISLQLDQDKPAETRPAFRVRFLSARERRQVLEKINAALAADHDDAAEQLIVDAIRIGLVGWENLLDRSNHAVPYDSTMLPEFLTDLELWELVGTMLRQTRLTEADLKNLGSPSDAATTASAVPAAE